MMEWKKLGEITKRNKGISITAGQMTELARQGGNIRVFAAGSTIADIDESKLPQNCAHRLPSIIVKSRGYIDFEFYEKPFTHKNEMWSYSFENRELGKYIYYFLTTKTESFRKKAKANSVKLPQLCVADTDNYVIPLPSVSEQNRIVEILDTFTSSIENLKQQIAARRKQYDYYRDQLLDFEGKEGVETKKVEELIISLKTGLNPRQNFRLNNNGDTIPYITGKDIFNNRINVTDKTDKINEAALALINKRACLESGLLLFASTGCGTVGRMAVIDKYENDWGISETLYAMKTKNFFSSKYLMYYLYSKKAKNQYEPKISRGSVPHLKVADLLRINIVTPSLSEQSRIVSILDTFEASISNLEAQLKEREKQYEYYRNKLLTFD